MYCVANPSVEKVSQKEFLPQFKHYFGSFCRANFFARTKALNFLVRQ
jgi:hypothetical protein